jgi:hypothetical protein
MEPKSDYRELRGVCQTSGAFLDKGVRENLSQSVWLSSGLDTSIKALGEFHSSPMDE